MHKIKRQTLTKTLLEIAREAHQEAIRLIPYTEVATTASPLPEYNWNNNDLLIRKEITKAIMANREFVSNTLYVREV